MFGKLAKPLRVNAYAFHLHLHKNGYKRHFNILKKIPYPDIRKLRQKHIMGHKGNIGIFTGIRYGLFHRNARETKIRLFLSNRLLKGDFFMAQKIKRYLVKVVRALGGIYKIGCHHRIKRDSGKPGPMPFQYDPVILYILAYLFYGRIFKNAFKFKERFIPVRLFGRTFIIVGKRHVKRFVGF